MLLAGKKGGNLNFVGENTNKGKKIPTRRSVIV